MHRNKVRLAGDYYRVTAAGAPNHVIIIASAFSHFFFLRAKREPGSRALDFFTLELVSSLVSLVIDGSHELQDVYPRFRRDGARIFRPDRRRFSLLAPSRHVAERGAPTRWRTRATNY